MMFYEIFLLYEGVVSEFLYCQMGDLVMCVLRVVKLRGVVLMVVLVLLVLLRLVKILLINVVGIFIVVILIMVLMIVRDLFGIEGKDVS